MNHSKRSSARSKRIRPCKYPRTVEINIKLRIAGLFPVFRQHEGQQGQVYSDPVRHLLRRILSEHPALFLRYLVQTSSNKCSRAEENRMPVGGSVNVLLSIEQE